MKEFVLTTNLFAASLMSPPIEDLLDKVDSKFSLVTLGARRARQINAYLAHLGGNMGAIVPPQLESSSKKPLSVAFEEVAAGLVVPVRDEVLTENLSHFDNDDASLDDFELGDEVFIAEEVNGSVDLD